MKSNKAFTIVEIIIVVVVIGILASIVLVSYGSTRNRAEKSSYNATAQQTKMKLGEFYTDNNHYPKNKTKLIDFLNDTHSGSSLISAFSESEYDYHAYKNSSKSSCSSDSSQCQYFEIKITADNWSGDSPSDDIVVKP